MRARAPPGTVLLGAPPRRPFHPSDRETSVLRPLARRSGAPLVPRPPAAPRAVAVLLATAPATAAVLLAVALPAGPAAPSAAAASKATTLRVTVSGTQRTTWTYAKRMAPTCDWPEHESGSQTITFGTTTAKPGRIAVTAAKDGTLRFGSPAAFDVPAKAVLRRDFDRRFAELTACPGGGSTGGGPAENAKGTRTCSTTGAVRLRLGTTRAAIYDAGDPLRERELSPLKPGAALVRGVQDWPSSDSFRSLPAACAERGQADADLGITASRGEWGGGLVESRAALPLRKLLRRGAKGTATVRIRTTVRYPNAEEQQQPSEDTTGRTDLDLRLTFRR